MAMNPTDLGEALTRTAIALYPPDYPPLPPDSIATVRAAWMAIASCIVDHVRQADVRIRTTDAGLQRDPESGEPTQGPVADVVLTGALE